MSGLVVGLISAGISATSAGLSFAQAGAQRRKQQEAELKADQAMAAARKKLDVNFMEALAIQKEPYELQREALLQQGATALQAGVEGETRGAAATAGRVQLAQQQAQGQVRSEMGKELTALEKETAQEESRLRDIGIQLDLGEASGAQQAAADAAAARAAAMQQGYSSAAGALSAAVSTVPLYQQNNQQNQQALAAAGTEGLTADQTASLSQATLGKNIFGKERGSAFGQGGFSGEAIGDMSKSQFRQFQRNLSPTDRAALFNRQSFTNALAGTTPAVQNQLNAGTTGATRGASYVENGVTFIWDATTQSYKPQQ